MNSKDILKITGMAAVFAVCALVGFVVTGVMQGNTGGTETEVVAEAPGRNDGVSSASPLEKADVRKQDPVPEKKDVKEKNPVPEITGSRRAAPKSSTEVNKLGYAFYTKAKVESGDPLSYSLYRKGDSEPAYTSGNGRFPDVYPVEGGKYLLKVRNTVTGDTAETEISGFDMVDKWSKEKLEEQLNSMNQEKMFYFHFDNSTLKFECLGTDSAGTLNALLGDRIAMGWKLKVLGLRSMTGTTG